MPNAFILEDCTESRIALHKMIPECFPQIQMDTAASYEEAVECLEQSTYDIFLLDINLNREDSSDTSGLSLQGKSGADMAMNLFRL